MQAQVGEELLEPQSREVLAALVEHVGHLVNRNEIHERAQFDRAVRGAVDRCELGLAVRSGHFDKTRPERSLRPGDDERAVARIR